MLRHAETEEYGGGQLRESQTPLAEQREVLVGQLVVLVGGC